jgi:hypothetical protein
VPVALVIILKGVKYKTSFGEIRQKKQCIFVVFCVQLVSHHTLIMHVPISVLHVQWHWCLRFNRSLNSQRFLQFHPTIMLVTYVDSCFIIILRNFFLVSLSSRISYNSRTTACRFSIDKHIIFTSHAMKSQVNIYLLYVHFFVLFFLSFIT